MVNPVDKLRKQQQKKLLLKQKKERQERNRNKFKNQSKNEVQDEIEKLQRKRVRSNWKRWQVRLEVGGVRIAYSG